MRIDESSRKEVEKKSLHYIANSQWEIINRIMKISQKETKDVLVSLIIQWPMSMYDS